MNFTNIWKFFTYFCRIFKTDRRPEYITDLANDDELVYLEINEIQNIKRTFMN